MSRYVATPCERFWRSPESWPKDRAGHVFLARAFQRIGKALFGVGWTGEEAFADPALSQPDRFLPPHERRALTLRVIAEAGGSLGLVSPEWVRLSDGQRDAALQDFRERHHRETIERFKRAEAVRDKVASVAASGDLKTAWRAIKGGDYKPIPQGFWITERDEPRFFACQMSLSDPFSDGVLGTHQGYIFVEALSAMQLVEGLPFADTQPLDVLAARMFPVPVCLGQPLGSHGVALPLTPSQLSVAEPTTWRATQPPCAFAWSASIQPARTRP